MIILGLSGSAHDCSATLMKDGKIVCAIEEERLSRIKHAPHSLPILSAKEVINHAGLKPENIERVAYFINPSKFNKEVLKHILFTDPKRYLAHPIRYRTHKFLMRGERYKRESKEIIKEIGVNAPIEYIDHHLAHSAGAFFLSPFKEAMIVSLDNMGEIDSTFLAYGKKNEIIKISSQSIPHSLGMLYATITDFLGFKPWEDEGKVMALAAYGKPTIPLEKIIKLKDGKFEIEEPFQMIQTLKRDRLYSKKLERIIGKPRKKDEKITQRHKNIAASVQCALEETAKYLVTYLHNVTKSRNLCLTGGVALNCKMNGELLNLPFINKVYVPPAPGDSGTSLGAAVYCSVKNKNKRPSPLLSASLGRKFSDKEILTEIKKTRLRYKKLKNISEEASELLIKEKVIAWFQGKAEFGPRALGNRSLLGLPQKTSTKNFINRHVKFREMWRPLCPSVISTETTRYFDDALYGRFMNIAVKTRSITKRRLPGAVHIDGTARIQKVYKSKNRVYFSLLNKIGEKIGDPVLLNTSFNVKEPIVDSPSDALKTFKKIPINSLIIGKFLVQKNGRAD